jgi:hypothetical protein
MLRLELLNVKTDLERELLGSSRTAQRAGNGFTGLLVLASQQDTGAHREPAPHGDPSV